MQPMRRRTLLLLPSLCVTPAQAQRSAAPPPAPRPPQAQPAPPAAPPPVMPTAEEIARIEAYLNGIHTLRARFLQVDQRGRVAAGTVYLQRPGRMRFEYDPPSPILIVADGTTVTYQDRELNQITSVFIGQTPLSIILAERVRLSGDVTVLRAERFANRLEVWLTRTASPREGTLILSFTTDPFALVQWRVIDAQAEEVRVTLSRVERDIPLEARLFRPPQPPAQSGDVAAQMRPQAPASAAGPERASAATANAASAQPPDERVLAMQELRAALTRESAGSDAQPTTPDVSSPAAPQPPVSANASAVTVPPSVGARTAAAPHTPLAQPATLRGNTTTPSIDESSVAATPPSALTSATAESVSPANSQGVDAPTRGAEAERVRGVPPPAPPTVTAVPAEAREAGTGGPGARGRQLSTFEAVMSPAPRPSTRVAHAIAAFQAVANAAALQPVGTGLNSLVQAAGTPAAILDRELPTQLVHGIRVQADSGGGAAQLRLNPTFLGGVTVGVQVDGTNVVASLHASNAEVREWMQRNEQVLRQSLADQGLNLQRLVIVDEDAPNAGREDGGSDTRQQQEQQQPRRPRRLENDSTFEIVL